MGRDLLASLTRPRARGCTEYGTEELAHLQATTPIAEGTGGRRLVQPLAGVRSMFCYAMGRMIAAVAAVYRAVNRWLARAVWLAALAVLNASLHIRGLVTRRYVRLASQGGRPRQRIAAVVVDANRGSTIRRGVPELRLREV